MAAHPYTDLPAARSWRQSAPSWLEGDYSTVYTPKFPISRDMRIATAGSCFAQHIGRNFRERGYAYLDLEPAPGLLPEALHPQFGYGIFSCRYGNVYTSRQLLQLIQRAHQRPAPTDDAIWEQDGRAYDGFRPSIEPNGFANREELLVSRASHLAAVRAMFRKTDVFVFTLGLTELWSDAVDGTAYPTCPGTVAGRYDPARHVFTNLTYDDVLSDMRRVIRWAVKRRPSMKFLITVSPVPLAATATGNHVVTATTYSKSVLRAVAGQLHAEYDCVDYFPSYEIITSTLSRGAHYAADTRNISAAGVASVMSCFFQAHRAGEAAPAPAPHPRQTAAAALDEAMIQEVEVQCDEAQYDRASA
jgi:hypothetical protein